jgi:hypothetical protein
MLAEASLPPKAAGINSDKEEGLMARLSASRPPLYLLEEGGVSRRLTPPTGAGQPAVANTLHHGGENAWGVAKGA